MDRVLRDLARLDDYYNITILRESSTSENTETNGDLNAGLAQIEWRLERWLYHRGSIKEFINPGGLRVQGWEAPGVRPPQALARKTSQKVKQVENPSIQARPERLRIRLLPGRGLLQGCEGFQL
ncbi:hypothetical protein J6590_103278 [Homalodisca vitripennis]|nr:hypothetical protein J6590_103278 [Homalodisca vitripennis]